MAIKYTRILRQAVGLFAMLLVSAYAAEMPASRAELEKATFAGGCFWCMQAAFDDVAGIVSTTAGYTGGHKVNPTYEEVSAGDTGHAEAVQIVYDPEKITYERILDIFWHNVDPTDAGGQFCDRGDEYRSEIFYYNDEQKRLAETSKAALDKSKPFKAPIVTKIVLAGPFYPAEDYHQEYHKKNPLRYKIYRYGCGRDRRLQELWGKEARR
jgi:peptide-methionine (S)-S-oxide reductase